jgi:hypothetical protein
VRPAFFNLRLKSLARGNVLVLGSLAAPILISHAPELRPSLWLILPALGTIAGTAETARCLRPRWSFFHITLALFFLLYPYFLWFSTTH